MESYEACLKRRREEIIKKVLSYEYAAENCYSEAIDCLKTMGEINRFYNNSIQRGKDGFGRYGSVLETEIKKSIRSSIRYLLKNKGSDNQTKKLWYNAIPELKLQEKPPNLHTNTLEDLGYISELDEKYPNLAKETRKLGFLQNS